MKNIFVFVILFMVAVPCIGQDKKSEVALPENVHPILSENRDEKILVSTEPMPSFPGGEVALNKFIKENLEYPSVDKCKRKEGQVVVLFAISPSGDVVNIRVKESLHSAYDTAVVSMIRKMPRWLPVNRKEISGDFTLPVVFRLQNEENE